MTYIDQVRETLRTHGNPATAQGQMWYMKYQFEFFGLKAPVWMALTRKIHAELGIPEGPELFQLLRSCFQEDHREMQYFGLETLQKRLKKEGPELIELLEELICTKSWWDTVDWIAKLVGIHFERFPEQVIPVTERWMNSEHMWLQRVSIIFQLRYKSKTDTNLLFRYILRVAHSKAFFLQKAAGWALRQHSRTNPELIRQFIETNKLPALTRREGLRLMDKKIK